MSPRFPVSIVAAVAELTATCLFVFIGTGAAVTFSGYSTTDIPYTRQEISETTNELGYLETLNNRLLTNASWGIVTAFAFGLAITVLAYATAHLSGGQLNPIVSFSLVCVGALSVVQGLVNIACQIVGAILGSAFVYATVPSSQHGTLGANVVSNGFSAANAFCGEAVMSFVLVAVVLETAVNKKSVARAQAPLAIGFAVFCAHAVLLPVDGCSINPARSLGPAIVSGTWTDNFWVFIIGPIVGAVVAIPFHLLFRSEIDSVPVTDPLDLREVSPNSNLTSKIASEGSPVSQQESPKDNEELAAIVAQAPADLQRAAEEGISLAAGGGLHVNQTNNDPAAGLV